MAIIGSLCEIQELDVLCQCLSESVARCVTSVLSERKQYPKRLFAHLRLAGTSFDDVLIAPGSIRSMPALPDLDTRIGRSRGVPSRAVSDCQFVTRTRRRHLGQTGGVEETKTNTRSLGAYACV